MRFSIREANPGGLMINMSQLSESNKASAVLPKKKRFNPDREMAPITTMLL
jgi:hypothetical protein